MRGSNVLTVTLEPSCTPPIFYATAWTAGEALALAWTSARSMAGEPLPRFYQLVLNQAYCGPLLPLTCTQHTLRLADLAKDFAHWGERHHQQQQQQQPEVPRTENKKKPSELFFSPL